VAVTAMVCVTGRPAAVVRQPPPKQQPTGERVLRVLGGSELDDMKPIFERAKAELGITVELTSKGSVQGARMVAAGDTRDRFDAIWFASDQFLGMWPGSRRELAQQSPPLMRSPVILGLHENTLDTLGWRGRDVTWTMIQEAVTKGLLRYAMTRPDLSNSGMVTLLSVATALANTGAPVTAADLPGRRHQLRGFLVGNRLSAESSRWLSDAYLAQVAHPRNCARAPQGIDGLFIYESEVLRLAAQEPEGCLVAIYPDEGAIVADYRLTLLRGASERTQATFEDLWRWLYSEDVQKSIVKLTMRRPGNPEVTATNPALTRAFAQLRFPTDPTVIRSLSDLYRGEVRPPSRMVFVLDTSGSMGPSMRLLKDALTRLTGSDPNDPTTYFGFLPGERVVFMPFSTTPGPEQRFELPATDTTPTLAAIQKYAQGLEATGWTAMYDALEKAHEITGPWLAEQVPIGEPAPHTSIVVFSDGQNTCGSSYDSYQVLRSKLPAAAGAVPIYTIAFGSGDGDQTGCQEGYQPGPDPVDPRHPRYPTETRWDYELRLLAQNSGGACFVARGDTAQSQQDERGCFLAPVDELYEVFWRIRGFQ
jgi:Ca-activated chloride channel family protein